MNRRSGKNTEGTENTKHIVDFNEARELKLEEKRKSTERIFFRNLVSVYSMIDKNKMLPIELIEVSELGCSFQVPYDSKAQNLLKITDSEFPIRLYFSQDTYLEVLLRIQNSRPSIDNQERYVRYGCSVDREVKSYPAYQNFVRFLKLYSEHAHRDLGDVSQFYL